VRPCEGLDGSPSRARPRWWIRSSGPEPHPWSRATPKEPSHSHQLAGKNGLGNFAHRFASHRLCRVRADEMGPNSLRLERLPLIVIALAVGGACNRNEPRDNAITVTHQPPERSSMKPDSNWKGAFEHLQPPPAVLGWLAKASLNYETAWTTCQYAQVRPWLARAGGATQHEIVAALAKAVDRASREVKLPQPAASVSVAALRTLATLSAGQGTPAQRAAAADSLMGLTLELGVKSREGAFVLALGQAIQSTKPADERPSPEDFSWLIEVDAAVRALIDLPSNDPLLPTQIVIGFFAEMRPTGAPPAALPRLTGSDLARLSDEQVLGRVCAQVRADEARVTDLEKWIDSITTLELEVRNGGFAQYFHNVDRKYAAEALTGYEKIGRNDLVALVQQAFRQQPDESFDTLDAAFWKALRTSPTHPALATYFRKHAFEK
jgi:hypothetical protein